jgi:hypothetical protein
MEESCEARPLSAEYEKFCKEKKAMAAMAKHSPEPGMVFLVTNPDQGNSALFKIAKRVFENDFEKTELLMSISGLSRQRAAPSPPPPRGLSPIPMDSDSPSSNPVRNPGGGVSGDD